MKLLYDFFPIFLFFIAYKWCGIYIATGVTMAASLVQVGIYWARHRRFDILQLVTLGIIILLGGSTLILHNDLFIKWKPTVVYWVIALVFLGSQFFFGKKPLTERLLGAQLSLPNKVWNNLNWSWIVFFLVMGIINIYVLYHFSTDAWVNFKMFGSLGSTIVFVVAQLIYMSRYLEQKTSHPALSPRIIRPLQKSSNDEL